MSIGLTSARLQDNVCDIIWGIMWHRVWVTWDHIPSNLWTDTLLIGYLWYFPGIAGSSQEEFGNILLGNLYE